MVGQTGVSVYKWCVDSACARGTLSKKGTQNKDDGRASHHPLFDDRLASSGPLLAAGFLQKNVNG